MSREKVDQKVLEALSTVPLTDIDSIANIGMDETPVLPGRALLPGTRRRRSPTKLLRPKNWRDKKRQKRLEAKASKRRNRK